MTDDPMIELAFAAWRFDMWIANYGTYEDIHWAVRWRLLRPFHKPGLIRGATVKKIIRLRKRIIERLYDEY